MLKYGVDFFHNQGVDSTIQLSAIIFIQIFKYNCKNMIHRKL